MISSGFKIFLLFKETKFYLNLAKGRERISETHWQVFPPKIINSNVMIVGSLPLICREGERSNTYHKSPQTLHLKNFIQLYNMLSC
jgi:hypothetical protein